jgi:channel protein (hemolysin III family)
LIALAGALAILPGVLAHGDSRLIIGSGLYLTSLVAVYAMSTLSHVATSVKWKSLFRKYDQAFIYLLIVATYTPFSLAYLSGRVWSVLLVVMWTVALVGFGGIRCKNDLRPSRGDCFDRVLRTPWLDAHSGTSHDLAVGSDRSL